ncbi:S-layer homology domain-containing protein [Paenibacillus sp. Leaf72]|uniref:S-layer homology domain-containing protein n=1 Tax=Paenibacillus sp. Leaf72 TaxID=1736234 RepID=UPI00070180F1|nr:S-layer homology domain-containing protein [Paenibacillus sp. Leaf72]KQO13751.1 hypothetical protein ASF12_29865 [Paenibacillus sp. Leaf72]
MKKALSRKIIALSTAFLTMFSGVVPALAASAAEQGASSTPTTATAAFNDTNGHWGRSAIEQWSSYGVVKGNNGAFRPNDSVTRAEFATMINNVMKYVNSKGSSFSDVSTNQWHYDAIAKLYAAGVLKGSNGKALPDSQISRQEAAVMLAKAFQTGEQAGVLTFKDSDQIAAWAKGAVQGLVEKAVIGGRPDGTFQPKANLTRAEAVTLFDHLVEELISVSGEYSQDVQGNLLINTTDVFLKNMTITGDLYIAQGVGEGEVTLDNVTITGGVYVQGGGEHSIIFNNVDVKGALVVNKYNGKVRVLATGSTSVSVTILESGAMLVTKELTGGGFETVEIPADILAGQEIKLDGSFTKVVNQAADVEITASGSIKELVAGAATTITGGASVEKVTQAGGANFTVTVNGAIVQPSGSTSSAGGSSTGSSSGGSNGGGSNSGGQSVAVSGVTVNPAQLSLNVGQSKQLTASVAPANAANKNLIWSIAEGSVDIIAVSETGVVTAKAFGTGTVTVTTADGGYTASAIVSVLPPAFGIKLANYEGALIASETQLEEAERQNSASVSIGAIQPSLVVQNQYSAALTAQAALQADSEGEHALYAVISLTDSNGQLLTDTSNVGLTVNDSTYNPVFGEGLTAEHQEGSFVLKLAIEQPDVVTPFKLVLSKEGFSDTTVWLTYRPLGTVVLQTIGAITGDLAFGSELTAGTLHYEGAPANQNVVYQWYSSDTEQGFYAPITGASSSSYILTPAEGGKYIRVLASADEQQVSGSALSPAFGPVEKAVNADEVFAGIESVYLGSNKSKMGVVSNLTLPAALPAFPGVTISWTSDNEQAVSNTGIVARDSQNDKFAKLTAVLGGKAFGTKEYEVIVRAVGSNDVVIENFIDPYFVANYPQAYVKDGTIRVKYALNKPAELYMVVNAMNGRWKSDVKAVIEGHAGVNNDIVQGNVWPYFKIEAADVNQVQEFNTGVAPSAATQGELRIEFAIMDTVNQYTSSKVTTILFDRETIGALDSTPPKSYDSSKFINKSRDTVYVYFDKKLDSSAVPAASEFALSAGQIQEVSLHNSESLYGIVKSYVKLGVSGISESDASVLAISYQGSTLRDLTDARNKVAAFSNKRINSLSVYAATVKIGSDRKSAKVMINPSWNPDDNEIRGLTKEDFVMNIAGQGSFSPSSISYSYSLTDMAYLIKFDTALPQGDAEIRINTAGIVDYAKDSYPIELVSTSAVQIAEPGSPTAVYTRSTGQIKLIFENGYEIGNLGVGAGFVLKVDGIEYALRGSILFHTSGYDSNSQLMWSGVGIDFTDRYSVRFSDAINAGADIQIKYVKVNGDNKDQLGDATGTLLPDFDYVTVAKQ